VPWSIQRREGKYCVTKEGASSPLKCYSARTDAIKSQRALYAKGPSLRASILTDMAPLVPPREWFEVPESPTPTPLTVEKDGQVFGHLALWDTCHTGFMNGGFSECVKAPRSGSDYSFFHLGKLETDQGDVSVGKLTYDTSHAPLTAGLQAASRHYDETGSGGAFVRTRDGNPGIWPPGAVRTDIPPEGPRDLLAILPSGDGRSLNHSFELMPSLAVVVPGFPIPRSQLSLAASANGELEVAALILPGYCECDALVAAGRDRSYMRRKKTLTRAWQ